MTDDLLPSRWHPAGEQLSVARAAPDSSVTLDTFAGPVKVEWDRESPLTPLGQFVYFAEFLKVSGRFEAAVADCPLTYTSPNAPEVRDVIGTWVLSALAGHKRYAHITALRSEAELRGVPYLFKLRLTKNVKSLIERTFARSGWHDAGQGWQGQEAALRLMGWSRQRRVIVLRRRLRSGVVAETRDAADQLRLSFAEVEEDAPLWEHAVLVTSVDLSEMCDQAEHEVLAIAQLYRDRADSENVFDELKNQWGWGGFTTHDLARCRLAARMIALVYNWWNIFVRLAEPDKHLEAITSRPLLLAGIAERTRHGRQTTLRITSTHGRAGWAERVLTGVARFLRGLIDAAEQLTIDQRWARILAHAVRSWLQGRQLRAPPRLMAPA